MARGGGNGEVELSVGVGGGGGGAAGGGEQPAVDISLGRLILAGMVAGGVQYGWALQLSLLTPYVQTLGLSHALTSFMWLCGPIAGLVVQPCVGLYSDKCTSRWGRRRPFILTGCILICIAVVVVGFSADIGAALGDSKEECSLYHGPRWHAAIVYVLGFWLLDFSNNTVQGPARALMADLSAQHGPSAANSIFCSWMALGNILGYSSGSTNNWHKWFPFLRTRACCEACANLKGAFLVAVLFLAFCLVITVIFAKEIPYKAIAPLPTKANGQVEVEPTGPLAVFKGFKNLPPGMPSVLLVTGLTWLSWFPFILYDTDWMGREIYHGDPKGTPDEANAFQAGVRAGAFGLLLNSVVLGFSSFLIEPLCKRLGPRVVWVSSNFLVCLSMAAICIISWWATQDLHGYIQHAITASKEIKIVSLALFAFLGIPLAILYSVPFAVTAQLAAKRGGGQGLCTGVLNIAIVIPQVIIAVGAGPWDELFGKGNIPAFGMASAFALIGGIVGIFLLPKISRRQFRAVSGGGH
ncbi:hypothetical protein CFC21_062917 [Triticum aestivum]|uniref:Sucrose transport protein SUT3 n=6 Tax=Triticinae TaxID=1648030 RepID=Q8RUL3_WHEAT|nr:sucrose transport protein SUT1 [Aegilops tauschii subsp. strangulata]XP_044376563.1 sucrose transport protein SUT1-like [Triticum aestivum]AAL90455.1 sucrose transporter SUT1D [Triticum aestivum]AAM13410.1 sucrose transporter SUT1D [Triticum aestivum]KAF7055380.1 hypothetical protein CFC21_062917 [Triticum aestivum]